MENTYDDYKSNIKSRIENSIAEMKTQPVLFIGSGLSIRYFSAPNWENLLREMADIPSIERDYDYYEQTIDSKPKIAEEFADIYNKWAWEEGDDGGYDEFPPWIFDSDAPPDIYLKYSVGNFIRNITPNSTSELSEKNKKEIDLLEDIQPHAVITTNYDRFLEEFIFPDYESVIGQTLVHEPFANIGEIFKIHGCVSRPAELVLTDTDYSEFDKKKPYLSSKLLTFFTEHPVLIVGYSPDDPNVKRILSDVNNVLSGTDRQPNIFLIQWQENIPENPSYSQERLIGVGEGEQMVVNYIKASEFDWIFKSFASGGEIKGINSKLLRKLLDNTYDIIVEEAPRRDITVESLESVANDKEELLNIFGIAPLDGEPLHSPEGSPSNLAEAGVPVGEIIRNEDVDDLQEKLQVAVASWREYDVLFENREVLYTFYNQRDILDLDNSDIDFLFRSCLVNIIQGSEWIIRYDGELDDLLSGLVDILNGTTVAALERNLLALGKEEKLREISETQLGESSRSNAEYYAGCCDKSPGERIKEYTGENIRFKDEKYSIDSLLSGSISQTDLLENIIEELIDNDVTDVRRPFRKIELVRIVNSPVCTSS